MPTVSELATWGHQAQLRLVTGEGGTGRDIARAVVWSPDRPGTVLHDGDLVVLALADWEPFSDFRVSRFIDDAAAQGVAAVLLIGRTDRSAERVAADRDVALLVTADDLTATGLQRKLHNWLADRQPVEERAGRDLLDELNDLAQLGAAAPVMLEHLTRVTRKTVVLHELGGTIQQLQHPPEQELVPAKVRRALRRMTNQARGQSGSYYVLAELGLACVTTVMPDDRLGAPCLSLIGMPAAFTYRDLAAVRAITLALRAAPPAPDESDAAALLATLMLGDGALLESEAEAHHHDLKLPHVGFATHAALEHEELTTTLAPFEVTYRRIGTGLSGLMAGRTLADQRTRIQVMDRLQCAIGGGCVGYSAAHIGPPGMRQAISEARRALRTAVHARTSRPLAYAQTRVNSLVQVSREDSVLAELRERVLAPLLKHDQFEPPGLLSTLETFLDNACVTLRTAEVLNCHRNSVVYRLQRIREISDVDLDDADTRLLLQLALRSLRLPG